MFEIIDFTGGFGKATTFHCCWEEEHETQNDTTTQRANRLTLSCPLALSPSLTLKHTHSPPHTHTHTHFQLTLDSTPSVLPRSTLCHRLLPSVAAGFEVRVRPGLGLGLGFVSANSRRASFSVGGGLFFSCFCFCLGMATALCVFECFFFLAFLSLLPFGIDSRCLQASLGGLEIWRLAEKKMCRSMLRTSRTS